jgi:hypothetical protein
MAVESLDVGRECRIEKRRNVANVSCSRGEKFQDEDNIERSCRVLLLKVTLRECVRVFFANHQHTDVNLDSFSIPRHCYH